MNFFTIYIVTIPKVIVIKILSNRQKQSKNENCEPPTASLVYDLTQRFPLTLPTFSSDFAEELLGPSASQVEYFRSGCRAAVVSRSVIISILLILWRKSHRSYKVI